MWSLINCGYHNAPILVISQWQGVALVVWEDAGVLGTREDQDLFGTAAREKIELSSPNDNRGIRATDYLTTQFDCR